MLGRQCLLGRRGAPAKPSRRFQQCLARAAAGTTTTPLGASGAGSADARQTQKRVEQLNELLQETVELAVKTGPKGIVRSFQAADAVLSLAREQLQAGRLDPPEAILRKLFEKLGATYIKLGQFIASSPSIFPDEYVTEFQKCLDKAEPVPFEVIKQTIREELSQPIEDVFLYIDPKPLATASIAQVRAAAAGRGAGPRQAARPLQRAESVARRGRPGSSLAQCCSGACAAGLLCCRRRRRRRAPGLQRPVRWLAGWAGGCCAQAQAQAQPSPLPRLLPAQVHSAILKASNKEVVLKVLKPGVEDTLTTDLNFVYLVSRYLAFVQPELERLSVTPILGEWGARARRAPARQPQPKAARPVVVPWSAAAAAAVQRWPTPSLRTTLPPPAHPSC
jgi:hypothetical protein